MTIEEHLEQMMAEVARMERILTDRLKDPDRQPLGPGKVALGEVLGNRLITPEGANHLWDAAEQLLEREKLQARISVRTARECLDKELQAEFERSRKKSWSYKAVVKRASTRLHETKTFAGSCFFPAFITWKEEGIDLNFGPVRVVSRDVFEAEFGEGIEDELERVRADHDGRSAAQVRILKGWKELCESYPFMVIVRIEGFEMEMARPAARQAAEFILNLLRIMARHRDGRAIRLSGDVKPETRQAFLALTEDGVPVGSLLTGGEGAFLPEDWPQTLIRNVGAAKGMIDAIAGRFVRGDPFTDPVIERIRYADQLITEGFQDASPRLALVKIVSALEALAVLPKDKKALTLEVRCALASCEGDPDYLRDVRKAVGQAYTVRNNVVHGDAPEPSQAARAIEELQKYLFNIVVHLWRILVVIQNDERPQSIKPLRRYVSEAYEVRRQAYETEWERSGIDSPLSDIEDNSSVGT